MPRSRFTNTRDRAGNRRASRFAPEILTFESRLLLTQGGALKPLALHAVLTNPIGYHAERPNTPVLPFGATTSTATFIDPDAHLIHGDHTIIGTRSYIAAFATLNSQTGYIKIGSGSAVLNNATIVSSPVPSEPTFVFIGDQVSIDYGATILGPSRIGAYGAKASAPTEIGPNAVIDQATITPGAIVGALARVGPGVTIPSGVYVLPGKNVTNEAEATNPALGDVEAIPSAMLVNLKTSLTRSSALAAGYTNLYQGNSATGTNAGSTNSGVFNGDLATIEGASSEPGPATSSVATGVNFEPNNASPQFPGPSGALFPYNLHPFKARVTGDVRFFTRARTVQRQFGRGNSVVGDQGQPIVFANAPTTGRGVTIASPLGGSITTTTTTGVIISTTNGVSSLTTTTPGTTTTTTTTEHGGVLIGDNFLAGQGAVILGGPNAAGYLFGNNVSVGSGAVVQGSNLGGGDVIGPRAYVSNSTLPANDVVPPGTILINNKVVGSVQW